MENKKSNPLNKALVPLLTLLILGGVVAWAVIGTQPAGKDSNSANNSSQTKIEKIKLGVTLPLTGELASLGKDSQAGVSAAIADFNKENEGTKYSANVEFQNDECKPTQATNIVSKYVNTDKVNGIIGPLCSGAGAAAMPIADKAKVPIISGSTSAASISKLGNYVFRTFPSDAEAGIKAAEYIFNKKGLKKASIVYSNNEYGKGLNEVFTKKFTELGGSIVSSGGFEETASDFATEIAKIKDGGAQALFFPAYPNNANSFLKQAAERDLNIYTLGTDGISGNEVLSTGSMNGKDLILPKSDFSDEMQAAIAKSAGQPAGTKYGLYTFTYYDATKALLQAIKKANTSDGEKVKDELYKTDLDGKSSAKIKFDSNGDVTNSQYFIYEVKEGKTVAKEGV
jgi:branched-chain amino acid transport system substrate-binding protein